MSMSGGISFFDLNYAAFYYQTSIAATSNVEDARYALTNERAYQWQSVGSDDSTTETLTITLSSPREFSRLFLIGHNFKDFSVQYGTDQDFTDVVGMQGALADINVTGYSEDTAYYEFAPVVTDTIIIRADNAQLADAEKILNQVIITNEIGTFERWPAAKSFKIDQNETSQKNASGGQNILKNKETVSFTLDMKHYSNQADIELIDTLRKRYDSFHVWLNGGKPSQFRIPLEGWRARDIYLMQSTGKAPSSYYKDIYILSVDKSLNLQEVDR